TDVKVTDNFLEPLIRHFKDNDSLFAVSPKVLRGQPPTENESITTGDFQNGTIWIDYLISRKLKSGDAPMNILYACGGAMLADKNKFLELGGFDEIYSPLYYEDTDLSFRAWKRGWQVIYEPKSTVHHDQGGTVKKHVNPTKVKVIFTRNRYIFIWKNITDPKMMAQHFIHMIIPKMLVPNIYEWPGLFLAFTKIFKIIRKRKAQQQKAVLTDKEVFSKFESLNKLRYL
ncbi:hypothetical protein ACFL4F_02115, partial [Candidatus Margulisiibacteriota bacterium]